MTPSTAPGRAASGWAGPRRWSAVDEVDVLEYHQRRSEVAGELVDLVEHPLQRGRRNVKHGGLAGVLGGKHPCQRGLARSGRAYQHQPPVEAEPGALQDLGVVEHPGDVVVDLLPDRVRQHEVTAGGLRHRHDRHVELNAVRSHVQHLAAVRVRRAPSGRGDELGQHLRGRLLVLVRGDDGDLLAVGQRPHRQAQRKGRQAARRHRRDHPHGIAHRRRAAAQGGPGRRAVAARSRHRDRVGVDELAEGGRQRHEVHAARRMGVGAQPGGVDAQLGAEPVQRGGRAASLELAVQQAGHDPADVGVVRRQPRRRRSPRWGCAAPWPQRAAGL
jgi:hypothetical protein